ncbi:unnamed protein product [Soboliphyme baturini]|uniref:Uncharacterized protein n=1 Tax=Soboliphyme baturini TaxID=241478 RepID=A0A183IZL5_9BILA|nr:unnamed protein product [Soboliphyme baturini]
MDTRRCINCRSAGRCESCTAATVRICCSATSAVDEHVSIGFGESHLAIRRQLQPQRPSRVESPLSFATIRVSYRFLPRTWTSSDFTIRRRPYPTASTVSDPHSVECDAGFDEARRNEVVTWPRERRSKLSAGQWPQRLSNRLSSTVAGTAERPEQPRFT